MAVRKAAAARWHHKAMSSPDSRRFPVTVTRLPVTPCQIRRTVAYRPGSLSEVLTEHYRRAHHEALGFPSRSPVPQTAPSADAAGAVLPAEGGLFAWAAQMTSVATERDRAMVRARARSRSARFRSRSIGRCGCQHRTEKVILCSSGLWAGSALPDSAGAALTDSGGLGWGDAGGARGGQQCGGRADEQGDAVGSGLGPDDDGPAFGMGVDRGGAGVGGRRWRWCGWGQVPGWPECESSIESVPS